MDVSFETFRIWHEFVQVKMFMVKKNIIKRRISLLNFFAMSNKDDYLSCKKKPHVCRKRSEK